MFCKKCGSKLVGDEEQCPYCGEPVDLQSKEEDIVSKRLAILEEKENNLFNQSNEKTEPTFNNVVEDKVDAGSFWYGVLGFFIPLAGLILFCVWRNEKPKSAKQAGIGALIQTIFDIIIIFPCIFCCLIIGLSS